MDARLWRLPTGVDSPQLEGDTDRAGIGSKPSPSPGLTMVNGGGTYRRHGDPKARRTGARCSRSLIVDGFQDRSPKIAGESGRVLLRGPDFCLQKLEEPRGFGLAVEVEV